MKKIKIGILGDGSEECQRVLEVLKLRSEVELSGVALGKKARSLFKKYEIQTLSGSWKRVFEATPDGVVVLGPPAIQTHAAKLGVWGDTPIWTKVPLSHQLSNIQNIVRNIEQTKGDRILRGGFYLRFTTTHLKIAQYIQQRKTRIADLQIDYHLKPGKTYSPRSFWKEVGIHPLEYVIALLGAPDSVKVNQAEKEKSRLFYEVEIGFRKGERALIRLSDAAPRSGIRFRYALENGEVLVLKDLSEICLVRPEKPPETLYRRPLFAAGYDHAGYGPSIQAFLKAIERKDQNPARFQDSESLLTGFWVYEVMERVLSQKRV